jgi:hypothetical protein
VQPPWKTRSLLACAGLVLLGCAGLILFVVNQRHGSPEEQADVAKVFDKWKEDILAHRVDQAMAYMPRNVDAYLATLNAPPAADAVSSHPAVDLLLRRALAEKVPADLRAHLTLAALLQRIVDENLFNPRELRKITVGPASVEGDKASAGIYYNGMITPVRLSFLKENGVWKIDVLGLLPYGETAMLLDRTLNRQSEDAQVNELVANLQSL